MNAIAHLAGSLLIRSGAHRLFGPLGLLRERHLILMYHRILPSVDPFQTSVSYDEFASDMAFIAKNFTPVALHEMRGRLPGGAVAVTIDDGYREVYDLVFPLVREAGIPVTVFVATDHIEHGRMLWTTELGEMVKRAKIKSISLQSAGGVVFSLGGQREKLGCLDRLKRIIKALPPHEGDAVMREIRDKIGVALPQGGAMLSWKEIGEMSRAGIGFGAHSRSHAILSRIARGEAWEEIAGSKKILESRLGRTIHSFCYPNGQEGDFNEDTVRMVREAGYELAVTTIAGINSPTSDRFRLKRVWTEGCRRSDLYLRLYGAYVLPAR